MKKFNIAFDRDWPLHIYIQQLKVHLDTVSVEVISPKSLSDWLKIKAFHMHSPYGWIRENKVKSSINLVHFMLKLFVLKCLRKRLIWTDHDLFDNSLLGKLCIQLLVILSDAIICHCEASKQELCEKFRVSDHKIYVIPHPNFIELYPNQITPEEGRKKFGLHENQRVFLFLGNVRRDKGILNLVRTFHKLNNPHALLLIAGQAETPNLGEQIQHEIELDHRIQAHLRYIPDDEVQFFMSVADYAVFPYERITTSGALILAMGFEKACIVADICCLGELTSKNGGFKYNPVDSEGLLNALNEASSISDEVVESMGKWNFNLVSDWNWLNLAQFYQNLYYPEKGKNSRT